MWCTVWGAGCTVQECRGEEHTVCLRVQWVWGAVCIVQGCRKHSVGCRVQRLIADSSISLPPSTPTHPLP